ncbi:BamA/TamA family outer membrane protein [bacterium]|nr:BamA/TamA family outer membrane protein [bacterium]
MNRAYVFLRDAIFTALVLSVLAVPAVLMAQETKKVTEIAVTGNDNINTDTILNAILLKVDADYDEQTIDKDKAAIIALGYFSAVTVHTEDVAEGVKVTFEVTENPKICDIKIVNSEPMTAQQILELMKTKPGHILNTAVLYQDIESIQNFYGEQGYIAYVAEDGGVDSQTGVLTVPIVVHRVESVEIVDNKKTKEMVFLREMSTKPGTIFNWKTLQKDMMKIGSLDILEDIKTPQINQGSEIGYVKVVLPVVEKKTGQMSVGVGYSSKQRLVGQARYSETNFRGLGQGLNLMWEQGTTDNATGGNASYELGFYEPWIDTKHTSLNVNAYNKLIYRFSSGIFSSDDDAYNERHKGGEVTVSRPMNEKVRLYLGGSFENVETDPSLLTDASILNIVQDGNVGSGSLRYVRNTRDYDLDPAAGGYDAVSFEVGAVDATRYEPNAVLVEDESKPGTYDVDQQPIPFDFSGGYQKTSIEIRRYYSKQGPKSSLQDKRTTWAMRLRAGYGNGTIPYFEQFFVGGGESLRGYREDQFWGDKMLLASIEYRKPIAQSIAGVAFVDYGDAWGTADEFNTEDLPQSNSFVGNVGVGIGLRVATPIGNLRLDYAEGRYGPRTHFSMGQAF